MSVEDSVELDSQLLLLIDAASVLMASPAPKDVLRNLFSVGQRFIKADAYAVWQKAGDSKQWTITTQSGLSEAYRSTVLDSERTIGSLPSAPIGIEDVASSEVVDSRIRQYEAEGIRSLLIVPIQIHSAEAGTIVFYYRARHRFTPSEMKVGAALGSLAAAALTTSELYEQQKQLREQAERAARLSQFLAEAGEVIASSLDYHETLKSVVDRAVPFFADSCAVDIVDGAEITRVAVKHLNPAKVDLLREIAERFPPEKEDAIRVAIRTGQSLLVEEIPEGLITAWARSEEHAALVQALGLRSLVIAPLVTRGQCLGCITFATAESGQRYGQEELRLAEEIARRAAVAIDNARLHKQVLASQQQWETLANSIPQLAWMGDEKGRLFWYNRRWYEFTGTTLEDMQGWGWRKVLHPDHADRVLKRIRHARKSGEPWEDLFPIRGKGDEWRWFLSRALPIRDESGRIVRWLGTNTDVTEQRSAREAVDASKTALARQVAEFETLLEVTPIGLLVAYDRECRYIRTNRAFAEWAGTDVNDNISRTGPNLERLPYKVFKDGQQLEGKDLPLQTAAREGKEVVTEIDLVRNDGRRISIFGYATPLFDENGVPRGSVGAFVDVTERRRAEQERQHLLALESEARATAELLNRIGPLLLTELDLNRLVQEVTDVARELTGAEFGSFFHNVADAKGESYSLYTLSGAPREAFEKFRMPRNTAVFEPTYRGQGTVRSDDITQDPRYGHNAPYYGMPEGHLPVRSYLAVPVTSRSGKVLGGLFFGHSASARFTSRHEALVTGIAAQAAVAIDNANLFEETRRTQRELQRTNEELRRANSDLEQFAYSASHDLKEPLRNVAIYSQLITRRYAAILDEQGHQFLGYVIEGARRMDALVNDLLAFTRVTGAEEETGQERTSALKALQTAISNLSTTVRETQAEITHGALPDLGVRRVHLQQLFQNLIGNSIKYRSEERPRIDISAQKKDDFWLFSVKDNGIGIDPEYKERIFGIFKRLHREDEYPGTGMGLAICHRIVERYGGRIWVESEFGRGATFFFTLPA